ncbi:MAG: hypothetical protein PHU85_09085 [Phycisphaerae bacterium]|nr:hypothetical protein [Phycisphaerae bacterium]
MGRICWPAWSARGSSCRSAGRSGPELFRKDIRSAEANGWLIFGRREVGETGTKVYGNRRQKEIELSSTFRTDWLELMTSGEQASALDSLLIAQWTRILYGHSPATNPASSTFSPITTDWVLLRHQMLTLHQLPFGWTQIESAQPGMSGFNEPDTAVYYGAGLNIGGDSAGRNWRVGGLLKTYYRKAA